MELVCSILHKCKPVDSGTNSSYLGPTMSSIKVGPPTLDKDGELQSNHEEQQWMAWPARRG
eukprot:6014480-Amphidinium_carterae.1